MWRSPKKYTQKSPKKYTTNKHTWCGIKIIAGLKFLLWPPEIECFRGQGMCKKKRFLFTTTISGLAILLISASLYGGSGKGKSSLEL
jgi:hypothetical protein